MESERAQGTAGKRRRWTSGIVVSAAAASLGLLAACAAIVDIPNVTEGGDDSGGLVGGGADGSSRSDAGDGATSTGSDATVGDAGEDAAALADGGVDAVAACVDASADPLNCGTCGHSCLGGTCALGVCQPFALLPAQGHPWNLAVDSTSVYWTDRSGSFVAKAAKVTPGTPVTLAAGSSGGATLPTALTLDADDVYWVNSSSAGGVRRCAKSGCGGVSALVAPADGPTSVAVDGTRAYFTEYQAGNIRAADKHGDGGVGALLAGSPGYAQQLAVDDTNVFWTDDYNNAATGKRINRIPKTGIATGQIPFAVMTGQSLPFGIVLLPNDVLWASNIPSGSIRKAVKAGVPDGGSSVGVAEGQPNARTLVVTGTHLYWVNQGADVFIDDGNGGTFVTYPHGSVATCELANCGVTTRIVAKEQVEPWDIAADATAVYWTLRGPDASTPGSIMKVAQ